MHGNPTYQGSDQPCGISRSGFEGLSILLVLIRSPKSVLGIESGSLPLNSRVPRAGRMEGPYHRWLASFPPYNSTHQPIIQH